MARSKAAHPRSRGENDDGDRGQRLERGSSPLTRGKRRRLLWLGLWRLAHPRSRGENLAEATEDSTVAGSSPLTRGKPGATVIDSADERLIPAHAGKTRGGYGGCGGKAAHPRSRGENRWWSRLAPSGSGSSPLTRGKRRLHRPGLARTGLIPAHAGKTSRAFSIRMYMPAHPRSRGENSPPMP